jgi:hypothetical protein
MTTRVFRVLFAAALVAAARTASAQEACKMVMMPKPALTLSDVYDRAEKAAKAWKADAVPVRVSNTIMGFLQPDGSSTAWNVQFYSAGAKQLVTINTMNGMFTCWATPETSPGRIPDLKPGFFRDGARLYAIAKEHAGSLLSQGYGVMLGSSAAPETRHAMWYLNFTSKESRNGPTTIIVDANSGKLENVLKD